MRFETVNVMLNKIRFYCERGIKMIVIAKKIKAALAYADKNQTDLANGLGISKQSMTQRMQRQAFSIADLEKIAEAIGCKFEAYFVFDDGTKI